MSHKYKSLQGLRGVAILAVLLFHFFPNTFPNGYLGVDVFFVLSGYLITRLLNKKNTTTTEFLYRRLKRIVPLHLLCILFSLLSLFLFFPRPVIDTNMKSVFYAISFTSNLLAETPLKQYAAMLAIAEDVFSHMWSLAVEVQFYLLAPFMFYVINLNKPMIGVTIVGVCSLIYHLYMPSHIAFNSLWARIWQFLCGSAVVYMTVEPDDKLVEKAPFLDEDVENSKQFNKKNQELEVVQTISFFMMLLLLITMCMEIDLLPTIFARVFSTFTAAFLVLFCLQKERFLLSFNLIVYLGDISYVLYLVHWPVFVYLTSIDRLQFKEVLLAIIFCVVLSALLHESYEKWYLRLDKTSTILLIVVLFVTSCVLVVNNQSIVDQIRGKEPEFQQVVEEVNMTKGEVIAENLKYMQVDQANLNYTFCNYSNRGPFGDCMVDTKLLNTEINKKAYIIGNSYASNIIPTFVKYCGEKFGMINMTSYGGCESLIKTTVTGVNCQGKVEEFIEKTRELKPDVLVMYVRHLTMMPLEPLPAEQEEAEQRKIEAYLKQYEKYTKKRIIILDVMPRPIITLTTVLNDMLKSNKSLDNNALLDGGLVNVGHSRLVKAVSKCPKCQLLDFRPSFTINGTFYFFNPLNGLSYFNSGKHITAHGFSRIQKVHFDLCHSL